MTYRYSDISAAEKTLFGTLAVVKHLGTVVEALVSANHELRESVDSLVLENKKLREKAGLSNSPQIA